MVSFQSYISLASKITKPECSNIIYYGVLQQRCDDKETLLDIINCILSLVPQRKKHILLEGDQATYERLQSIRRSMLKTFVG